ncbi:[NiFe] hydrogenase metallocenter assembly protein HypD [hydrothermal vent metagenome]|uniref:[NiFe] hydrogenase metallocenter assembly protein HypD n=1 Tax=hydrothermal vent metagenome TaxID=652676 RepID=A0A3B1CW89_9ZZZZ
MKFIDEYRDEKLARNVLDEISRVLTSRWVIMEICGGQTHAIVKYGLDQMFPDLLELVHGPGCPVCVTPLELIDKALAIASSPDVIFCSFGDMMRVPGSGADLLQVKAQGGDIRVVYSPLDALKLARENPDKKVVFFAVGFETTAPANAMAVWKAREDGIQNFSMLVSHVLVPPAMTAILDSPANRVEGFLAAGHVCTVMGTWEYEPISTDCRVPIVVSGFEPLDILEGILMVVRQLEQGKAEVENQYTRIVTRKGNTLAQEKISDVFEVCDRKWRGIGEIPRSGLRLKDEFKPFDAAEIFNTETIQTEESPLCISGEILQGLKKPGDCPAFGDQCTPENPLGATMISSEGTCAAFYQYGRHEFPGRTVSK